MTEEKSSEYEEMYGIVFEHKCEAPLLMEMPMMHSSYENANKTLKRMLQNPSVIRAAIVEIVPTTTGNTSMFRRKQKCQTN